ncbi:MAG TPA: TetR/AcrR family transcriptional regulator [Beutenbergiaceae bacterium]|nr:TetR/AcrR family transcriptional regulator [Beutenbergiaceae bacterium]
MVRSGPETTRTELLYAAALEIAERGYSGASFSSVAARLGLTKGAFAYHFPTKQALAVALMEEFDETFSNAVAHAREDFPSDDLRTALFALREIEAKADAEPVVAAAFILMCDPQPPVEEIHDTFRRWIATFIEFLQNAKASGQVELSVPLEDAADFLVISLLGLTNLSHRTFARSSAKDQMHLRLLFSALGVSNTEALITEVLGVPQP